jgi:hypothetical protein
VQARPIDPAGKPYLPSLAQDLDCVVATLRKNGRYRGLLRDARLKVAQACMEDVNYKTHRGLDKSLMAALADGAWILRAQNLATSALQA